MFFINLLEGNLQVKHFAKNIHYYTTTQSTNDDVWELYNETGNNNIVVITDNQTHGRGRLNNSWFSKPSHSITCSFLLSKVFKKNNFNLYAILVPVAIIRGIKDFLNLDLTIKWPNDIMYQMKKLGGILIESKNINNSYLFNIGIGLNVNERHEDFPSQLRNTSISLQEIKGHTIQREPLLACILNELDSLIEDKNKEKLIKYWMQSCMHIESKIGFKYQNKVVKGIFKLINEQGKAVIEFNNEIFEYDGAINLL